MALASQHPVSPPRHLVVGVVHSMSPALSLAHLHEAPSVTAQRIRDLERKLAGARAALEQASQMAEAAHPRGGKPVPAVVVTLALSSISAVCQAALEES